MGRDFDIQEYMTKGVERVVADESVEFIDKGGVLSQIDLGIVKYHFEVGREGGGSL